MSLIGICGEIGSGKTTLATYLKTHKNYKEYSIAGPLKKNAINLGFINPNKFMGHNLKN